MTRICRMIAVVLVATALLQVRPAHTQSVPPPPLLPGETLYQTSTGCAVIVHYERPSTATEAETNRQFYAKSVWRGACRTGLAHGAGTFQYPTYSGSAWVAPTRNDPVNTFTLEYGRFLGRIVTSGEYGGVTYYTLDGRSASVSNGDPLTPTWRGTGGIDSSIRAGGWLATTFKTTCYADRERFPDCSSDNNYDTYGMWIYRPSFTEGAPPTIWCPNPRTPVGCEGLWREQSAPIYANYQAIVAEVERDVPTWRNQLAQLNAPREAQIAAMEIAKREAIAREQAEADEAAAKEEKAFQATLTAGNPGQLFALADELRERGETDRARQVLRTLVSRFPNHALATTAAEQLSRMSGSPRSNMAAAPPASSRPAAITAPAATASYRPPSGGVNEASCQAEVNRLADVLNGSASRTANNVVWQLETLMYVLKAMADTTDAMCPRTPAYTAASADFRQKYSDSARTCSQVSSATCVARLH